MTNPRKSFRTPLEYQRSILAVGAFICLLFAWAGDVSPLCAQTVTETTLYSFQGSTDSQEPVSQLIQASDGYFYGTASGNIYSDFGSVFRITPQGQLTTLYNFTGVLDGGAPYDGLFQGSDGNLYGSSLGNIFDVSLGTIFRIAPAGGLVTLHGFSITDGAFPTGGLIQGNDGKYYGATPNGGVNGFGTFYAIDSEGLLATVHDFTGLDAASVNSRLLQGSDGNFYGVASSGGTGNDGTIFKISPTDGAAQVVYNFTGAADGATPQGSLTEGSDGSFYGVAAGGGANGFGTIFKITSQGTFTTLYAFSGGADGANPAGLFPASDGNFYGTTYNGGKYGTPTSGGTIFSLTASGAFKTLYSFGGPGDGASPQSILVQGADGNFYGTTQYGGTSGSGTVFSLTVSPALLAPVQLIASKAKIAPGDSITLSWQVLNAFSTTMQQCNASVQGGSAGAGAWVGIQAGSFSTPGIYAGSTVITPGGNGNYTYALTCGGIETGIATVQVGDPTVLSVATANLPSDTVGAPYATTLVARGGTTPYAWSLPSGSLPPGLTLDQVAGIISGTPTQTGTSSFVVQVKDSTGATATASLSIQIQNGLLRITTSTLPDAKLGLPYSVALQVAGGTAPYRWSTLGAYPSWLNLDNNTGVLSGTPTAANALLGTSNIGIKVSDSETLTASAISIDSLNVAVRVPLTGTVSIQPTAIGVGQSATAALSVVVPSGTTAPTGTVQFEANGVAFGPPIPLTNGKATFPGYSFTSSGTYSITANYSGDFNYQPLDYAPAAVTVTATLPPEIDASPTTVYLTPLSTTSSTTLTLKHFPSGTATFTCSGLPAATTCTFGALSAASTVVVQFHSGSTAGGSMRDSLHRSGLTYALAMPGLFSFAGLFAMRRRYRHWCQVGVVAAVTCLGLAIGGCASSSPHQSFTSTPVTVTANSGAQSATVQIVLVVQN